MQAQQMPAPPIANNRPTGPPVAPAQSDRGDDEQFIETLAQRLMPRLMPDIMHQFRDVEPLQARTRTLGMSLALAITSVALMIPLTAIILGILTTAAGGGIGPALIGLIVVSVIVLGINVLFNYLLFNARRIQV